MQKYIVLLAIFILGSNYTFAQCDNLLRKGEEQYNKKEYKKAVEFFSQASELNCPGANDWIGKCNARINEQTAGAVNAQVAKAKAEAKDAKAEAEVAKTEAKMANAAKEKAEAEAIAAKTETAVLAAKIVDSRTKAQAEIDALKEASNRRKDIRRIIAANLNSNPTQSFDNGNRYKGETTENVRNGLGVYLWRDGTIYLGEFKDDNMDGVGIYITGEGFQIRNCEYGTYYSGGFSDNLKSGAGCCYDELGNLLYNGMFADDKPVSEYPDDSDQNASYKFEMIDYDNNGKYIGSTVDGQRNGLGVYFWDNGDMWFGNWENGQRDGYGIHLSFSGAVTTGTWNGDDYSK